MERAQAEAGFGRVLEYRHPIWLTIRFVPTKLRILRFDADRLHSGNRMVYGDVEVVK